MHHRLRRARPAAERVMTHAVIQQLLDGIELRKQQPAEQVGELATRLREARAEREALQTTAKTIHAMAADLGVAGRRGLPQAMSIFDHERQPLRACERWCPATCRSRPGRCSPVASVTAR